MSNFKSRGSGFTLIELLVVIAIIALLLSVMMPSLRKAKEQARSVVCRSNLKQWGTIFGMYANDNEDSLTTGYVGGALTPPEYMWMEATRSYYKHPDLRVCPETRKPLQDGVATGGLLGDPHLMWGIWSTDEYWFTKGDYGSYGINGWVQNPPKEINNIWIWQTKDHWRKITSVSGTSNIPLFMDSWWVGGFPNSYQGDMGLKPPEFEGDCGVTGHEMKRYCIDRHGGGTLNGLFLDFSVRKIGLKELWRLKWNRSFDTNNIYTQPDAPWPEWMKTFKDY